MSAAPEDHFPPELEHAVAQAGQRDTLMGLLVTKALQMPQPKQHAVGRVMERILELRKQEVEALQDLKTILAATFHFYAVSYESRQSGFYWEPRVVRVVAVSPEEAVEAAKRQVLGKRYDQPGWERLYKHVRVRMLDDTGELEPGMPPRGASTTVAIPPRSPDDHTDQA